MTIHQLYEGGPANSTLARTQWPAYTFNAADAKFAKIDLAQHYGTPYAVVRRVLDFKNDLALRRYFTDNASAAADVLNLILIPKGCLLLAAYVEVENPADGGALQLLSAQPVARSSATIAARWRLMLRWLVRGSLWLAARGSRRMVRCRWLRRRQS